MARFILILLLISTAVWADDDTGCRIEADVAITKIKQIQRSYVTIESRDMQKNTFLVKSMSSQCKDISDSEIFSKSIIKNPMNLKFEDDTHYKIIAHLVPMESKDNLVFILDSIDEYNDIVVKLRKQEEHTQIIFMVLSNMETDPIGHRDDFKLGHPEYPMLTTHIVAKVNQQTVFEVRPSANLARHPSFRFKFKNIENANKIEFFITTNKGRQRKIEFSIPESLNNIRYTPLIETHILKTDIANKNPKIFEVTTVDKAVAELYGSVINPIEGKINIEMPKDNANAGSIPINISSDVDFESIAVFSDKLENPTIAVFYISPVGITNYDFKIKVRDWHISKHSIIVIGKSRDGKFYKAVKEGGIFHRDPELCGS